MSGSHAPGQYWKPIFEQIIDSLPWNARGTQQLLKAEKFEGEAGRGRSEVVSLVPCLPASPSSSVLSKLQACAWLLFDQPPD